MLTMWFVMSAWAAPDALWTVPRSRVVDMVASPAGGDLLVLTSGRLDVLSVDDGSVRRTASVCRDPLAMGFVGDDVVVACEEEAMRVSWPALEVSPITAWSGDADAAGVGAGGFAVATDDGQMQVFRAPGFEPVRHEISGDVEAITWGPDAVVLSFGDSRPQVLFPDQGAPSYLAATGKRVAISADGSQFFAKAGGFDAMWFTPGRLRTESASTGSWVNDLAFLPSGGVLAGGSDGLVIYRRGEGEPATVERGSRWGSLAVSTEWFCAANWDTVGCWGRASVSSEVEPMSKNTEEASAPSSAVASEYTLRSRAGTRLTLGLVSGAPPAVGTQRAAYLRVNKQLGPATITAWLSVATVKVLRVDGEAVVVEILEELSIMHVNDKKVDHFKAGSLFKLDD